MGMVKRTLKRFPLISTDPPPFTFFNFSFFNALVYFRLRFIQCGKDNPTKSNRWRIRRIIALTLCPCVLKESERHNLDDGRDVEPEASFHQSSDRKSECSRPYIANFSTTSHQIIFPGSLSYPSFPSRNSSEPSCTVSDVGCAQDDVESMKSLSCTSAAGAVADSATSASMASAPRIFYQKIREQAREMVDSAIEQQGSLVLEPEEKFPRSYRDVLNDRRNAGEERERDGCLLFNRLSDLSTIVEGSVEVNLEEESS